MYGYTYSLREFSYNLYGFSYKKCSWGPPLHFLYRFSYKLYEEKVNFYYIDIYEKIFVFGNHNIVNYLNPRNSRVRQISCPNFFPSILRNEKLPNLLSKNRILVKIGSYSGYQLVSDYYCLQINYCPSFNSITKNIKIKHFIGSLEHYELLMNAEVIVEKFYQDFNVNEKNMKYTPIK